MILRLVTAPNGLLTLSGYKVHLSESCDENAPRLITHVETTGAPVVDQQATPVVHKALEHKKLLPQQHLVDAAVAVFT